MIRRFENDVAVVTGAASGIGRALALRLSREGVALALADLNAAGLAETVRAASGQVAVSEHVVDVSDSARMKAFADQVLRHHGRVSILVNNAGTALHGLVEEVSLEDLQWLMGVNFWSMVFGVKNFLPVLRRQPRANIVNLSSIFGIIAPPGQAAYSASKFAVRGFTEALRHELAGTNVVVTSVHPGCVQTPIARHARLGAATPAAVREDSVATFERLARTTPEAAADRIVLGIKRGEPRILIGADAVQIDRIQRLFPTRYWRIVEPRLEKRAGRPLVRKPEQV